MLKYTTSAFNVQSNCVNDIAINDEREGNNEKKTCTEEDDECTHIIPSKKCAKYKNKKETRTE